MILKDLPCNYYDVDLIEPFMIRNRWYYNVKIINTLTDNKVVINEFSPSPFDNTYTKQCHSAMNMIVAMSLEWLEDKRNDDDDDAFETTYNQLHEVMSDDDMNYIRDYYYDRENDIVNGNE